MSKKDVFINTGVHIAGNVENTTIHSGEARVEVGPKKPRYWQVETTSRFRYKIMGIIPMKATVYGVMKAHMGKSTLTHFVEVNDLPEAPFRVGTAYCRRHHGDEYWEFIGAIVDEGNNAEFVATGALFRSMRSREYKELDPKEMYKP